MVSVSVLVPKSTHICTGDVQAGILPFKGGTHGFKVRQRRPDPHVRIDEVLEFFRLAIELAAWNVHIPNSVLRSQRQPLARAHCSTSRWPPAAAFEQAHSSQRQPLARAHMSTSRWPFSAAEQHVSMSQRQPLVRNHLSDSRWPPDAAAEHAQWFQRMPRFCAHSSRRTEGALHKTGK